MKYPKNVQNKYIQVHVIAHFLCLLAFGFMKSRQNTTACRLVDFQLRQTKHLDVLQLEVLLDYHWYSNQVKTFLGDHV